MSPVLLCMLIPASAIVVGGVLAWLWTPGSTTLSAVQHFTAGLVLSAVAVELIPQLFTSHQLHNIASLVAVSGGFVTGVVFMLGIGYFTERAEGDAEGGDQKSGNRGLIFAVGTDLLIDGLLVGTTLVVGARQGMLVALALTIEAFFLSLATATTLRSRNTSPIKLLIVILSLGGLLAFGVLLAQIFSKHLVGLLFSGTLAFATAALLYLVVEELLVEAHQQRDRPATPALFFAGFLLLLILQLWIGA
ncbi:MAG: hypothetical protein N2C12_06720 [Planctomycetales bacterium]